jgi:hypothetical protein
MAQAAGTNRPYREEKAMSRELLIGIGCGLIAGAWLSFAALPGIATAQQTAGTAGLYQIQVAAGLAQPGTSAIWRVNTATGALDFCTFTNVTMSGATHITCQGNLGSK